MKTNTIRRKPSQSIKVNGFFRVHIKENGKVVGDSGWIHNRVVNLGFSQYLVDGLAGAGGAKTLSRMNLGTGGEPAAGDTALAGELNHLTGSNRTTITTANNASTQLRCTATWASSTSHVTANFNLSNIGLLNDVSNQTTAATIFAGTAFTSSLLQSNQDVNATYDINFS